ncbi:MAG: hypothetical protein ABI896_03710 [Actinomycetota bacterium]
MPFSPLTRAEFESKLAHLDGQVRDREVELERRERQALLDDATRQLAALAGGRDD